MEKDPRPHSLQVSHRFYGMLLKAYPPTFRCGYRKEMAQLFDDCCRDAYRDHGLAGLLRLWSRAVVDVSVNAAQERIADMTKSVHVNRRSVVILFVAVLCSTALAYVDLHNDEVQAPLLILLVSTCILGFVQPKRAWLWAVIVGIGIPISELLSVRFGHAYPCRPGHNYSCTDPTLQGAFSTFFVLVPALLSAYFGAWMNKIPSYARVAE